MAPLKRKLTNKTMVENAKLYKTWKRELDGLRQCHVKEFFGSFNLYYIVKVILMIILFMEYHQLCENIVEDTVYQVIKKSLDIWFK